MHCKLLSVSWLRIAMSPVTIYIGAPLAVLGIYGSGSSIILVCTSFIPNQDTSGPCNPFKY